MNLNLGIFYKTESIFHVDFDIARNVLGLAMTEPDLDRTKAERPLMPKPAPRCTRAVAIARRVSLHHHGPAVDRDGLTRDPSPAVSQ